MYPVDRRGWSEAEGVIVEVCMIASDEGCEAFFLVHDDDGDRVK